MNRPNLWLGALPVALAMSAAFFVVRKDHAAVPTQPHVQASVPGAQPLSSTGAAALQNIVNSANNPNMRWPNFTPYKSEFTKVYTSNSLVWVRNNQITPQGLAVIELLEKANAKGLDPEDYDGSRWAARLTRLSQNPSEQDLVATDTALTVSAMRYFRAVHVGRVNPKEFKFELVVDDGTVGLADFLQTKVIAGTDPTGEIEKLEPPFPGYRKLMALLPVYEGYARQDDGEKFPMPAKTVRPGEPYSGLPRLGRFLKLINDIPPGTNVDPNPTVYEGVLVDGVKHYQARHGESPTGLLDARTINELNTPPAARIRQIRLTLERWRWIPHSF